MYETPSIEVHLVEGALEPGGAGEIGLPAVAPAVANAVFGATQEPVRSLPIRTRRI
jgi:isoquinoline 1-oxidoreductase beta subunit